MPRPRLVPSDEQRKHVKKLAAMGIAQRQIAKYIDIRSPKTLRKYYRKELNRGELEGYLAVKQTHFQMATDGKHQHVTNSFINSFERRHSKQDEPAPVNPPALNLFQEKKAA